MMTKKNLLNAVALALFAAANLVGARLLAHENAPGGVPASSYIDASEAEIEALFAEATAEGLVVTFEGTDTASDCRQ